MYPDARRVLAASGIPIGAAGPAVNEIERVVRKNSANAALNIRSDRTELKSVAGPGAVYALWYGLT